MLFAGLLINREKVPVGVGWLQDVSFFHAAFEGLLVNEVRYLQLIDHKYGVDIEVPAATILYVLKFILVVLPLMRFLRLTQVAFRFSCASESLVSS